MKKQILKYWNVFLCVIVLTLGACNPTLSNSDKTIQPTITKATSTPQNITSISTVESKTETPNADTIFASEKFHVSLVFPKTWQKVSDEEERYQGPDGFLLLNTKGTPEPATIQSVCE